MIKMTTEELAEYILNHSLDEAISKCEEILKDYVDEVEDWEDEDQSMNAIYDAEHDEDFDGKELGELELKLRKYKDGLTVN